MIRDANKKIIAFIISLALFMDALDTTIINTAIPAMSHSLKVNPVDLKVALISYLLSLAMFIPISGWIADKYGSKKVFIGALIIFLLSSFWCGIVHTLLELVIARSIQGLGGSLMLPLGRLIILRTFKRHEFIEAMNSVVIVISLGLMLGPLIGGVITDRLSWQWIFWVNIPVGVLVIIMAIKWLQHETPIKVRSFDWLGFFLFGGGIASLVYSLSVFSQSTANPQTAFSIFSLALLLLIGYFLHSNKHHQPIINLDLLKIRTFQVSIMGNIFSRAGFGSMPFLLPLLFQVVLGYSAESSGFLLAPIALGIILVKAKSLATRLLQLFGHKRLLLINTFFVGLSLWSFNSITSQTPVYVIATLTFILGFFISLQYTGMNSIAYADITADNLSAAISIHSVTQQLSQSFGVAIAALLMRYFSLGSGQPFSLTPKTFHHVFTAMSLITLISTLIFMRLKKSDGWQTLTESAQEKITAN